MPTEWRVVATQQASALSQSGVGSATNKSVRNLESTAAKPSFAPLSFDRWHAHCSTTAELAVSSHLGGGKKMIHPKRALAKIDQIAWYLSAVFLTLGAYLLFDRLVIQQEWWPMNNTDMSVYLNAAKAVSNGQSMYDPTHYPTDVYGYPPLFAELIAIVRTVLGDGRGWIVWMGVSLVALFASIALMLRGFGRRTSWKWVILVFSIFFAGHITRSDLYHLQPHFFLLLLIVLGLRFFSLNKPVAGGLAWAAVFVCKPFTGALIFFLMRRGEWRAVISTLVAASALFLASFLPFFPNIVAGVKGWISASGFHTGWPNVAKSANETFYGLFTRLFGPETKFSTPWIEMPGIVPFLMLPFLVVAILGIYLAVSGQKYASAMPAEERGAQDMVQMATVLGFAMSCGPLMESPHCFMLLPGLVGSIFLARQRWAQGSATKWRWTAAAGAWTLTMFWLACPINLPIVNLYLLGHVTGPALLLTVKLGLCLLASCLLTTAAVIGDRRNYQAKYGRTLIERPSRKALVA